MPSLPIPASRVADYFLAIADEDDVLSNLKLQKLCYYAQGFCLAETGRPLFPERIERWQHGPVVRSLYHAFKEYERQSIPFPDSVQLGDYPEIALELIDRVYGTYGPLEAWALRDMTHREPPWRDSTPSGVITKSRMRQYFKTQELPPDTEMLRFRRAVSQDSALAAMTRRGFEEFNAVGVGAVADS